MPSSRSIDAVCDPAGAAGEEAAIIAVGGKIPVRAWTSGAQVARATQAGAALKAVRQRLNRTVGPQRALLVHRRCRMTIRAFATKYYYQRIGKGIGDGYYSDVPKKVQGYTHLMDALQYGCFERKRDFRHWHTRKAW
jgi:hypothetical protein